VPVSAQAGQDCDGNVAANRDWLTIHVDMAMSSGIWHVLLQNHAAHHICITEDHT
jgi:hypothetical protein